MKRFVRSLFVLSAALCSLLLATSDAAARAAQVTGCPDAYCMIAIPEALVGAGDDLIWSANQLAAEPPWPGPLVNSAELWTMAKAGPYNSQRQLYREERATAISFGSVLAVGVGGVPYVYFVANYDGYVTYIKRVPLAGGSASTVSRTSFIGARELISDGAYLYWADVDGVRRMALAGGAITTLFRTNTATQLGLDANYLYFNAGADGASLHRVAKAGGAVTLQASGESRINDLFVHVQGAQTTMFWAEQNAAVRSRVVGSSETQLQQAPAAGRSASAVAFDGARVLWIDCAQGASCPVRQRQNGETLTLAGGHLSDSNFGAKHLVVDNSQLFWATSSFLYKYAHTPAPSIVFDPALIKAQREGGGVVSASVRARVSGGDAPFKFRWFSENPAVRIVDDWQSRETTVSATLAACDSYGGDLKVVVTDAIGRKAEAFGAVEFMATRPPRGVCD